MTPLSADLIFYLLLFMIILLSWAVAWMVLSLYKIRTRAKSTLYWQANFVWNVVNFFIAIISIYTTAKLEAISFEHAVTMRNIVAVNVLLDVVYIMVAIVLMKSTNSKKQQIGKAVLVQGLFLLVLDIAIVAVFQKSI